MRKPAKKPVEVPGGPCGGPDCGATVLKGNDASKPPKWRHGKGIHKHEWCCTRSKCRNALGITNEANAVAAPASETAPTDVPAPPAEPAATSPQPPPSDPQALPTAPAEEPVPGEEAEDLAAPAPATEDAPEEDWRQRPTYSYADMEEQFQLGLQTGREEAARDRAQLEDAESAVNVLQTYLRQARDLVSQLELELQLALTAGNLEDGLPSLEDVFDSPNPAQADILAGLRWAELLPVVCVESVSALRERDRATRAQHGK